MNDFDFKNLIIDFAGPVDKREASIEDSLEDFKNQILGGKCITDDNCSPISYCDRSDRKL